MQIPYGKAPTMQIYPCWQPGAEGQLPRAGFTELVPYCCPTSRRDLFLVAGNHGENMVLSEPGLCWQGGEEVKAPAMTCCIAAREGRCCGLSCWAPGTQPVEEYWGETRIGSREGAFGQEGTFGPWKRTVYGVVAISRTMVLQQLPRAGSTCSLC